MAASALTEIRRSKAGDEHMMCAPWPGLLFSPLLVLACASGALAQPAPTTSYSRMELAAGQPVRLGYYANAQNNCMPAPPPSLQIIERPRLGALTVRRGILTTSALPGCPGLKTPAVIVFYESRDDARGTDHVVYQITTAAGANHAYDVTIEIAAPAPPAPPKKEKI